MLTNTTTNTFNLSQDNIEDIAINTSNDGETCYISRADNRTIFYGDFIIYDGPKVKKCCSVTFQKSSKTTKFIPRLVFYKINQEGNIVDTNSQKVNIEFNQSETGLFEFWKLISFLKGYKDLIDVGDFDEKYKVIDNSLYIAEFKNKQEFDKVQELKKLDIDEDTLKSYLADKRKDDLVLFAQLLADNKAREDYRTQYNVTKQGDEAIWHHFLKNRTWILGLNTELKFIQDFADEVHVGNPDTTNKGNPTTDLMGISDYTTLVELKTSETKFFTETKTSNSRAGTWSFSAEFIEGISQCLSQKNSWDKNQGSKQLVVDGSVKDQNVYRTTDPNTVFIIGNKEKELPKNQTTPDILVKRDTLERFRRNSRNVVIISYDELYQKAYYIVHHTTAPDLVYDNEKLSEDTNSIPF